MALCYHSWFGCNSICLVQRLFFSSGDTMTPETELVADTEGHGNEIEVQDWSHFCCGCDEITYHFSEDVIVQVESYRCLECFYKNVEVMPEAEEEEEI
jgi:hypothetical protein